MADGASQTLAVPLRNPGFAQWFLLGSVLLHVAGLWLLTLYVQGIAARPVSKPMEMVMFEVEKPKPPDPVAPPPPPKVKPKIRVSAPTKPPPEKVDPAPPPPNEAPTEAVKPAPLVVGLSLSSTTSAGNFAAPVGNTLYGKAEDKATAPDQVKAYGGKKFVPAYQLDQGPEVSAEVKPEYTAAARQAGVEGQVVLTVTVEPDGSVSNAKLLRGLGYGLDESALRSIRRYHFKPAIKNGEAVSTNITFTMTFVLD